ncbi:2,3-bisphosphoglycerate-dependent phosphoglycerate mutase [Demequina litorisediminis]|uniref:phosphoglycerate mutase (2,3-diphosphoglycerate-dependent) n=1 Tax=Demequina litorisediminis TaxID=1849022 RepID=A0ABQ6IEJ5_9MICO|nr:hypothetical protein GCM10025876_13480 [Demequina litorisediminis]
MVHTSLLRRAIMTANLALDAADRHWIPVKRDWRLNERHYGDLQGKNKAETLEQFGEEQFMTWRRSYDVPPPVISAENKFGQDGDPRYAGEPVPQTECLKDVLERALPYWEGEIVPDLKAGKTVLVAAHGNSLRAIIKHLDGIADDDIVGVNVPTGIPLVYEARRGHPQADQGRRHLPRRGRRCCRDPGGREPGQEVRLARNSGQSRGRSPSHWWPRTGPLLRQGPRCRPRALSLRNQDDARADTHEGPAPSRCGALVATGWRVRTPSASRSGHP